MGRTTHDYDIVTRLAVGNGALVYRAVDKITHRQVALKLLVQDENIDHRFQAEPLLADAPALARISGAHICQLLDAYNDEDGPVLVYEFAQGVSGAELYTTRKPDAAQAIDIAAQLISALRSGERQKVPHGDLKPSNVIVMELGDGRPFVAVLDWALTAYRAVVADDTLPCLAPERLHGAGASHRADLFSAGATLFFFCTGKTLISAKTRGEAESAWLSATPAVLAEMRPDLPAKFVQWMCSLLETDPEKRPESAVEALKTLAALNPPPPPVPPESFRARPASQIASGIVAPPPGSGLPRAGGYDSLRSSGIRPAPELKETKPAAAAAKNSHVAMAAGLFVGLLAMIGGGVWFLFFRRGEPVKPPVAVEPAGRPAAVASPSPVVVQNGSSRPPVAPVQNTSAAKPANPPKPTPPKSAPAKPGAPKPAAAKPPGGKPAPAKPVPPTPLPGKPAPAKPSPPPNPAPKPAESTLAK